tara:strand:+ start:1136 stop:1417 length:282 start_codon:yes stop_codon:yes gene_type:complete
MNNPDDLLRDQISQLIRAEIQDGINDYVDEQEVVEKAGLGFVGKEDEKELKVKVPVSEVDKIIKEYKKIKKKERSNFSQIKKLGLLDQHGRQL